MNYPEISFDNTEFAFEYKSTKELKKARFLFSSMAKPWLVNLGIKLTPWALKNRMPIKGLIRSTIFKQFVGGETLEQTAAVARKLGEYKVEVILDYGVEGGKESEKGFEEATQQFIQVIDHAATEPNIPFMSIKPSGLARHELLEQMDSLMRKGDGTLMKRYLRIVDQLTPELKDEWKKLTQRMMRIAERASQKKIGVLIDAEESWIQDPIDALAILLMDTFNRERCVVYNTIQLYRQDRLQFLKDSFDASIERGFILGAKLVRGAYMEKERKRAGEKEYPSPIQPDKESTDRDYNAALKFCVDHLDRIALMVASHNEYSNLYAVELLEEKGLPLRHPHIHWSQLFGMSDNITFNLAHAGCSVSKYLPFGPINDVIPYLMRRAQENTSVKGQTGRELGLIRSELRRRGKVD
jgi:proline dehydrogenase